MHYLAGILLALPALLNLATAAPVSEEGYNPLYPTDKEVQTAHIRWGNESRDVAYFTTSDGFAVIDGDVLYGTVDELKAAVVDSKPLQARAHSNYAGGNDDGSTTWPNGVVTWTYVDATATGAKVNTFVQAAITNWQASAPWLTFKYVYPENAGKNGILTIKATNGDGCWSDIGYRADRPRWMNLQQDAGKQCMETATTHEFGHALGFRHEHQRPDRDQFMTFSPSNMQPQCPAGTTMPSNVNCASASYLIPKGCCAHLADFSITPGYDYHGKLDTGSIMQYSTGAFALSGLATLKGVNGVILPIAGAPVPDAADFTRVCKLYRDTCPAAVACRDRNCPAECTPVKGCSGQICNPNPKTNPNGPPDCCDPELVQACLDKKRACDAGCGFMING